MLSIAEVGRQGGQAMNIDEAIKHCKEVAESCNNSECALDHNQLAARLEELKRFKQTNHKGN